MVDLNFVCDQQLRQNDKAIITVFYFTEGGFGITFQVQQQRAKLEIEIKSNKHHHLNSRTRQNQLLCSCRFLFYAER